MFSSVSLPCVWVCLCLLVNVRLAWLPDFPLLLFNQCTCSYSPNQLNKPLQHKTLAHPSTLCQIVESTLWYKFQGQSLFSFKAITCLWFRSSTHRLPSSVKKTHSQTFYHIEALPAINCSACILDSGHCNQNCLQSFSKQLNVSSISGPKLSWLQGLFICNVFCFVFHLNQIVTGFSRW